LRARRRTIGPVGGTIALVGGGPFRDNDVLDRQLLTAAGAERVVVLPTADAFEEPSALVAAAMSWAERLAVEVDALMVLQRHDAEDPGAAEVVRAAPAVYLVGDSSQHLRSALKETPVFTALGEVLAADGLIVAVGACAAALCDPMLDQRGGAFTLGLGLVRGMAVIPEAETWSEERLLRTLSLADTAVVELPTGAAVVGRDGAWELTGSPPPTVHGELSAVTPR
jgi:cyanophycinase